MQRHRHLLLGLLLGFDLGRAVPSRKVILWGGGTVKRNKVGAQWGQGGRREGPGMGRRVGYVSAAQGSARRSPCQHCLS